MVAGKLLVKEFVDFEDALFCCGLLEKVGCTGCSVERMELEWRNLGVKGNKHFYMVMVETYPKRILDFVSGWGTSKETKLLIDAEVLMAVANGTYPDKEFSKMAEKKYKKDIAVLQDVKHSAWCSQKYNHMLNKAKEILKDKANTSIHEIP